MLYAFVVKLWIQSLPLIKEEDLHCVRLPNRWNFGFDYSMFVWIYLIIAIPCNHDHSFDTLYRFISNNNYTNSMGQ